MSNTYIRSSNDYTMSAHSIFAQEFGEEASVTKVFSYNAIGMENLSAIIDLFLETVGGTTLNINHTDLTVFNKEWEKSKKDGVLQKIITMEIDGNNFVFEFIADEETVSVVVLGDSSSDVVEEFLTEGIKAFKKPAPPVLENTFYTIASGQFGFELESLKIKNEAEQEGFLDNYNEDFAEVDAVIKDAITTNQKGLMLLHGVPGSGKTSYIRHLITLGAKRKIVYIPTHLTAAIASPEFISFVKDRLVDSVLVVEDAEAVLLDRDNPESHKTAVSNLLNMTDGILADALNLLIICTFNKKLEDLDDALLRKGRLKLRYEFNKLSQDRADKLAMKLFGKTIGREDTLANIYNLDYELITPKVKEKVKVGFY